MSRLNQWCIGMRDHVMRYAHCMVLMLLLVGLTLLTSGCLTSGVDALRIDPYRPETRRTGEWYERAHPSRMQAEGISEPREETSTVVADREDPVSVMPSENPVETVKTEEASRSGIDNQRLRALERGDRVTIQVDGPESSRIEDMIDGLGMVTLPHIGAVRLAGRTTSEVENAIEKAYIDGKIFRYVNVTVVSLDDEFFVKGEVKKEGRFQLTGNMTLAKALVVAGGFTEFAKTSRIEIKRGNEILRFDMKRIDRGEEPDPLIRRGDVIKVFRRWVW
ncbi:MAG: polysaccharide export protein [Kiritimatiellae bacterium]|nr:polysaccharide export protein [Kiritimatiellia bacterium]